MKKVCLTTLAWLSGWSVFSCQVAQSTEDEKRAYTRILDLAKEELSGVSKQSRYAQQIWAKVVNQVREVQTHLRKLYKRVEVLRTAADEVQKQRALKKVKKAVETYQKVFRPLKGLLFETYIIVTEDGDECQKLVFLRSSVMEQLDILGGAEIVFEKLSSDPAAMTMAIQMANRSFEVLAACLSDYTVISRDASQTHCPHRRRSTQTR